MGSHNSNIYLEGLISALDLEVMEDQIPIRQVIPQMGYRDPFGIIDWLADGNHCRHYRASSIALSMVNLASASARMA